MGIIMVLLWFSNLKLNILCNKYSVHPPALFCLGKGGGRGGWTSNQNFKKGGLTGSQLLEAVAGKEEVTFLRGWGVVIFT